VDGAVHTDWRRTLWTVCRCSATLEGSSFYRFHRLVTLTGVDSTAAPRFGDCCAHRLLTAAVVPLPPFADGRRYPPRLLEVLPPTVVPLPPTADGGRYPPFADGGRLCRFPPRFRDGVRSNRFPPFADGCADNPVALAT
jgi:hypothetical protein